MHFVGYYYIDKSFLLDEKASTSHWIICSISRMILSKNMKHPFEQQAFVRGKLLVRIITLFSELNKKFVGKEAIKLLHDGMHNIQFAIAHLTYIYL